MNFTDYQLAARRTAIYPADSAIEYCALGLCSEAGEVAGKIKKVIRDNAGIFTEETRAGVKAELGDILWYSAQLATELQFDLDEIAAENLAKLRRRQQRQRLGGSGDER